MEQSFPRTPRAMLSVSIPPWCRKSTEKGTLTSFLFKDVQGNGAEFGTHDSLRGQPSAPSVERK